MIVSPADSYGFQLKMLIDQPFRNVTFASSDHPDAKFTSRVDCKVQSLKGNFKYYQNKRKEYNKYKEAQNVS